MSGENSPTGKPSEAAGTPPGLRASHADRDRTVDVLRVAAGDGRLTAAELDERLEAALTARTLGELTALTADLPPVPAMTGGTAAEVKDVIRLDQVHSRVERAGRWVVPRRLEVAVHWSAVTLDFTEAVITQDTLRIDVDMEGKTLTLITRPGLVVDTDGLRLVHSRLKHRPAPAVPGRPPLLRVELAGRKVYGRVVVRPARRILALPRSRGPASPAADG
jgi:hypothetical protein